MVRFFGIITLLKVGFVSAAQGISDHDFRFGIGFYYKVPEGMVPFTWPVPDLREKGGVESRIITLPEDTAFYAYGLDLSQAGVPPHLFGFKWGMHLRNGSKDGDWAMRFIPVKGTKEKTYRIGFDGPMEDLASGRRDCDFWHMDLPLLHGLRGGEAIFVFRFGSRAEAEARRQAVARQLQEALSKKGVSYKGSLDSGFGFMASRNDFSIEFESYDPHSGLLSGRIGNFSGFPQLVVTGSSVGSKVELSCKAGDFEMQMSLDTMDGRVLSGKTGGLMPRPVSIDLTGVPEVIVPAGNLENAGQAADGVYPETRSRLLKADEVENWSKEQLQYAINEMFARYGLYFRDEKVRSEFLKFDWYRPDPSRGLVQIEAEFSEIEKANLKLLSNLRNGK